MWLSLLIQFESVLENKIKRNFLNKSIQKIKVIVIFNRYLIKSLQYRLDFYLLENSAMKKTKVLSVLLFLNLIEVVYAQDSFHESPRNYIINTAIVSSPTLNEYDGFGTSIAVYSLIIGIYVLYWFKQKI